MRIVYSLLLLLITPAVLLRLLWRSYRLPAYRQRIGERFGFVTPAHAPVAVWVHAVSVGETLAALPLIRALVQRHGAQRVWVTTTTPTGSERVQAALGTQVLHSYAPYDLPGAVARFLERVRPQQVVIMETELWPNLFYALHARGVALTIANARLSPRSFRGYGRVARFARSVLQNVTRVAAQSSADGASFEHLGAPRVEVLGNLKFDVDPPQAQIDAGRALRERMGAHAVWVAASTHEGEEDAALRAHAELRKRHADARLILVPRHPQRFDAAARAIERAGMAFARRSALPATLDAPVLLGDSLGEMWMYLASADLAFVGGSLVPVGGHNVLEPAALGLPVLFGPHMHNFIAARDLLLGCGCAVQVDDAATLAHALAEQLDDAARRTRMGEAGRLAVMANRGALQRLLAALG